MRVIEANDGARAERLPLRDAGVRAGQGARRLRDGRDDDQAAGLRPLEALSRSISSRMPDPGRRRCATSGAARSTSFTSCSRSSGVIVWILDNRSAGGRGVEAQWPVYGRLGELELQDLEDGVTWLKQQPYVDASRIVLSGWSYGGFMTAYALTHSTSWSAGIAGGPVTDWRDYDTIYTERYMKLPRNNADGYRQHRTAVCRRPAARPAAAPARHDGRQRAPAEHAAVRVRAAARRQAVRDDALSAVAPRHRATRASICTCAG